MIELDHIKKSYHLHGKEVLILKGINVFISQGEFVSIMGPSGSGKSTLSAILGCLSTPTSGSYKLDGREITKFSQRELARLRNQSIGFIFQDFNLLNGLSALENVALPLVYGGHSAKARRSRAMECLAAVGLDHKAHNRPFQLSGGQKQRIAIARALVNHPKFLFADEPTGALDKKTGHEILSIMQRLNIAGHTVIQVTHSVADAQYSKRILHLVDGNIVREETVERPTIGNLVASDTAALDEGVTRMWRVAQFAPVNAKRDLPAIAKLLEHSSARDTKIAAARAIIRWPRHNVENNIEGLFTSDDWVVRAEVVKNVNLLPKDEAIAYYIRALDDQNAWIRHVAMSELKDVEQVELNPDQIARVVGCVEDPDERVRASCIFIIGKWDVVNKSVLISQALNDGDSRVRANAVECLTDSDDQLKHLDRLRELSLQDRNNRVRANAALIVCNHDPVFAVGIAVEMLASADILMRSSGVWLLGNLKDADCHELLLATLFAEKDDVVINQLVRSLAKLSRDKYPLCDQIDAAIAHANGIEPSKGAD